MKQGSKNLDERPHCRRQNFFTGNIVMLHWPFGSIAVSCSSGAVMPLLRSEWSLLLYTLQQRLPMIFNELDHPHIVHFHGSLYSRVNLEKRHLDQFSRFCTARPRDQYTDNCSNRLHLCKCNACDVA